MVTLKITHHVSGDDLAYALAYWHSHVPPEDVTKKMVEMAIRRSLEYDGSERLWCVVEDSFDGPKVVKNAAQAIQRLYPEMHLSDNVLNPHPRKR